MTIVCDDEKWNEFDEGAPKSEGFYEWACDHKGGFRQRFFAEMRMRGNGYREDVLSPDFDYWDGYRVLVPIGFLWRNAPDQDAAKRAYKNNIVVIDGITLRDCPFCGTQARISASQCGYPGGGGGVVLCARPHRYNTWRIVRCCRLIGFNGFASPLDLAAAWNGGTK